MRPSDLESISEIISLPRYYLRIKAFLSIKGSAKFECMQLKSNSCIVSCIRNLRGTIENGNERKHTPWALKWHNKTLYHLNLFYHK